MLPSNFAMPILKFYINWPEIVGKLVKPVKEFCRHFYETDPLILCKNIALFPVDLVKSSCKCDL